MKKTRWMIGIVSFLLGGICLYMFVDLCSFSAAVPPEATEVVDDSDSHLSDFELNGTNPLKTPQALACGATVKLKGTLLLDMKKWRWLSLQETFKMTPQMREAKAIQDKDLPRPMVAIELLRKSSIGSGEVVASRSTLMVFRKNQSEAEFSGLLQIPETSGVYRLRVMLGERIAAQKGADPVARRTIKYFNIDVVTPQNGNAEKEARLGTMPLRRPRQVSSVACIAGVA